MRTPRTGRLGLLGVGAVLALAASTLSPVTANAAGPTSPAPGVTLSKAWSGNADTGPVTATLTLSNTGAGNVAQSNVTIVDTYDPGLTYSGTYLVSNGSGSCAPDNTIGFRRIICSGISVPAATSITITLEFTGSYWGYRTYTKNYVSDERLDIQKAETHVDIQSDDSTTATVTCPANYDLLDYSWHLQQVDQDTGDFYDVYLLDSTVNLTSATVELFNDAGGKAQGKLWALCLRNTTNLAHPVVWNAQSNSTEALSPTGPYERPFFAECPQGYTPAAINLRADPITGLSDVDSIYMDDLFEQTGLEADGSRRAIVWAVVMDHADFHLQWRCLNTKVGSKRLSFKVKTASQLNVPMHDKVAQEQITCDVGYKGAIGGWRGGHFNGSEPRPKTRVYWLWHDGPGTKNFTGELLCLKSRLMRGGKVKKSGVTDDLYNHVFGTTQSGGFYIDDYAEDWTPVTQVN